MSDTFNVTAAYDKTSYNVGDVITVTISGFDVTTTTTTTEAGPLQIPVVSNTGVQSVVNVASVSVLSLVSVNAAVTIDKTRPIVDTSATPRTWTVANNGLSITATA